MIELLIVAGLMMFLMVMAAPFTTSIRSDISMRRTLHQIKTDLVTNMGYALAGKSIAALSAGDLMNPDFIPSHYALHFKTDSDFGDPEPYYYMEMTTEVIDSDTQDAKTLYQTEKEMPSPVVYLKDIRLKTDESDPGTSVNSAFMFFTPPFGKITFVSGYDSLLTDENYSFNPIDAFEDAYEDQIIELDFQFKDDETSVTTLSFGTDKVINIL
ncbi:hypothetical protein KJ742_02485 [Patescibacteria group bacterium]|nr:hypothetical protein [Patescibacteria group bacterium]MBU1935374.1 hypothetical protein [Patescibacteria group bacterium]